MSRVSPRPEITPDLVLRAYSIGLFPMGEKEDDDRLYWVDPDERGVFPLDGLKISRSLAKVVRSDRFEVLVDQDFDAVIEGCAHAGTSRDTTWINPPIRRLYRDLFDAGFVHTSRVPPGRLSSISSLTDVPKKVEYKSVWTNALDVGVLFHTPF